MMRFDNTGYKWVSEWPGEQKLNPFCDEYELTTVHVKMLGWPTYDETKA